MNGWKKANVNPERRKGICVTRLRVISAHLRDRRDVTAIATQVNKCAAVNWAVKFYITGNGKMMTNVPYLFKFTDFFISLRLIRRKIIVFCSSKMILIAAIFHKLFLKNSVWVG